jgi:hypothetical protein
VSVAAVVDGETYADSTYMNTLVDAINQGQSGVVNALIDGVVADGVTDNTAAMQVAIDRALDGSGPATAVAYIDLPAGDIAIDGPLDIPFVTGFELRGKGKGITRIVQQADNVPILNFATDPNSHTIHISDLALAYANQQDSGDTDSVAILVGGSAVSQTFNWIIERISIDKAYRGLLADTASGNCGLWSVAFRDCHFSNMTGASIRAADSVGRPNWLLDHILISNTGGGPTVPVEAAIVLVSAELVIRGLDIEGWNGQHLDLSGSTVPVLIDGYHMENSTWTGTGQNYINYIANGGFIARGVSVAGTVNKASGDTYIFKGDGNAGALCQIDGMNGALTMTQGDAYPLQLENGATGYVRGILDGTYTDNPINTGHATSVSGLVMTNGTIH